MFLLWSAVVQSKIIGPGRGVGLVGSSLTLTCSTDSNKDVCWEYYPNDESIPQTIFTGRHVTRQYAATHHVSSSADGSVSLTLLRAQLSDAGVYQCRECSTVHSADTDVIVLGRHSFIHSYSFIHIRLIEKVVRTKLVIRIQPQG